MASAQLIVFDAEKEERKVSEEGEQVLSSWEHPINFVTIMGPMKQGRHWLMLKPFFPMKHQHTKVFTLLCHGCRKVNAHEHSWA